jgi:ankyrin repeat protein
MKDHGGDELIETHDEIGNTPLHIAAMNGHLSCVRILVESAGKYYIILVYIIL